MCGVEGTGIILSGTINGSFGGEIGVGGKLPISTMGGLKSRGHPVGATGVYQLVEIYEQLTGIAAANQVHDPELAPTSRWAGKRLMDRTQPTH